MTTTKEMTVAECKQDELQRRECLLCGRDCAIVRKVGPLLIKEPCPNACTEGYATPARGG